jgi:hypothetical protein
MANTGWPKTVSPDEGRNHYGRSSQVHGRAWTVSWMSMYRMDQYPGRGSRSCGRAQKSPAYVTAASQMISPTARTHGVDPNDITMSPAMTIACPTYPTRRAQTAILQCPLYCNSSGSFTSGTVRAPRLRAPGSWFPVAVLRSRPTASWRGGHDTEPAKRLGRHALAKSGLTFAPFISSCCRTDCGSSRNKAPPDDARGLPTSSLPSCVGPRAVSQVTE